MRKFNLRKTLINLLRKILEKLEQRYIPQIVFDEIDEDNEISRILTICTENQYEKWCDEYFNFLLIQEKKSKLKPEWIVYWRVVLPLKHQDKHKKNLQVK